MQLGPTLLPKLSVLGPGGGAGKAGAARLPPPFPLPPLLDQCLLFILYLSLLSLFFFLLSLFFFLFLENVQISMRASFLEVLKALPAPALLPPTRVLSVAEAASGTELTGRPRAGRPEPGPGPEQRGRGVSKSWFLH